MCSSAGPSWYLPESRSCSTNPTSRSVFRIPNTVPFGSPSSPASSATPSRRDRPDSSRRIAAARSIDWMWPGIVPGYYPRARGIDQTGPFLAQTLAARVSVFFGRSAGARTSLRSCTRSPEPPGAVAPVPASAQATIGPGSAVVYRREPSGCQERSDSRSGATAGSRGCVAGTRRGSTTMVFEGPSSEPTSRAGTLCRCTVISWMSTSRDRG